MNARSRSKGNYSLYDQNKHKGGSFHFSNKLTAVIKAVDSTSIICLLVCFTELPFREIRICWRHRYMGARRSYSSSNDCKIPGISMVNEALKFSAWNRIIDTYILIKTGVCLSKCYFKRLQWHFIISRLFFSSTT